MLGSRVTDVQEAYGFSVDKCFMLRENAHYFGLKWHINISDKRGEGASPLIIHSVHA